LLVGFITKASAARDTMKPFYTIKELVEILDEPIYKIPDILIACGATAIHKGEPADFSMWEQYRPTPGKRRITFEVGGIPSPDPSHVVVNAENLPQVWKDFIKVQEQLTQSDTAVNEDRPIGTRERNTLLVIIAALAKEANIDLTKPSKAGELIANMTQKLGAPVDHATIEQKIKLIENALESRSK
jgi:hypothetical protein